MLVDLTLRGKVVLVIGSGAAARARAAKMTYEGAPGGRVGTTPAAGRTARAGPPAPDPGPFGGHRGRARLRGRAGADHEHEPAAQRQVHQHGGLRRAAT